MNQIIPSRHNDKSIETMILVLRISIYVFRSSKFITDGYRFGSRTVIHRKLSNLSKSEKEEVRLFKKLIEKKICKKIEYLKIPVHFLKQIGTLENI